MDGGFMLFGLFKITTAFGLSNYVGFCLIKEHLHNSTKGR